jgi:hypothetical protein
MPACTIGSYFSRLEAHFRRLREPTSPAIIPFFGLQRGHYETTFDKTAVPLATAASRATS